MFPFICYTDLVHMMLNEFCKYNNNMQVQTQCPDIVLLEKSW